MLEWIELSAQATIVASETGASLHLPQAFGANPFREPMRGAGSARTTRALLEGVIALAGRSCSARRAERRSLNQHSTAHDWPTSARWAYRLTGYFHTTHATHRLLPQVAERFANSGRPLLRAWAEQKITEEAGHDQLALRDLNELGYDAGRLARALCPPRAAAWVSLFESLAREENPAGCVGYAHALERLALLRGPAQVAAIEGTLPPGLNATRCLRVHSALGSDKTHVDVNIAATAASSADDRRAIAAACHATALIYFDPAYDSVGSPIIDEQLSAHRARTLRHPSSYPNPSRAIGIPNG